MTFEKSRAPLVRFAVCDLTSETQLKFRVTRFGRVQDADRGTKAVSGAFMGKLHLGLRMPLDASAIRFAPFTNLSISYGQRYSRNHSLPIWFRWGPSNLWPRRGERIHPDVIIHFVLLFPN